SMANNAKFVFQLSRRILASDAPRPAASERPPRLQPAQKTHALIAIGTDQRLYAARIPLDRRNSLTTDNAVLCDADDFLQRLDRTCRAGVHAEVERSIVQSDRQ